MFDVGQVAAVEAAFHLAGHTGPVRTLRVESEDERIFVVPQATFEATTRRRALEQVLTQLLARKVVVTTARGRRTVPFG